MTYNHINQVVYGLGREELSSISTVGDLVNLIADRIHKLRVKRNPTFDVLSHAPPHINQPIHPATPEVVELSAPFLEQTNQLNAKQKDFQGRKRQLANIIEDVTPAIATIMASRTPLSSDTAVPGSSQVSSTCVGAQPVRVDVRDHGTFFVRAKPKMKSYRAPTLKTLKDVSATSVNSVGLSNDNFKTQFWNLQQTLVEEFHRHLQDTRSDTQCGVRFCLDRTTKARR